MSDALLSHWPLGADGEPEKAALLGNEGDFVSQAGIACSMLDAYGIPYLVRRSGPGQLGLIYGGFSPVGVKIYVPESRLEEARQLVNTAADAADEEDKEEEL